MSISARQPFLQDIDLILKLTSSKSSENSWSYEFLNSKIAWINIEHKKAFLFWDETTIIGTNRDFYDQATLSTFPGI